MKKQTVVLGLSGGVDSAVAGLLLKKQGYNVMAVFMKNFSDTKNPLTGECSWVEEKEMAKRIASLLEIPFYVFDFEKEYKNLVIKPMYEKYKKGLTPNPDITCNTIIKFPLFWKKARKLGADYIALGHYARIKKTRNNYQLLSGKDKSKDQSYFLYELSQEDLSHTLFPIGDITKEEVRKIAKENNFPNWNKRSTRGICFVGKVNMKKFLEKHIKNRPGIVKDSNGKVIGKHQGIMYYTIGQRIKPSIGIEISKPSNKKLRYYVAEKKGNIIIATPKNHPLLKKNKIYLTNIHIIDKNEKLEKVKNLKARIRHLGKKYPIEIKKSNNKYQAQFKNISEPIAPGQSLVIYKGNRLVGGAEIAK